MQALLASAEEFENVRAHHKSVASKYLLTETFNEALLQMDDTSTRITGKVMMMGARLNPLIMLLTVSYNHLLHQILLQQNIQRAVDRSKRETMRIRARPQPNKYVLSAAQAIQFAAKGPAGESDVESISSADTYSQVMKKEAQLPAHLDDRVKISPCPVRGPDIFLGEIPAKVLGSLVNGYWVNKLIQDVQTLLLWSYTFHGD